MGGEPSEQTSRVHEQRHADAATAGLLVPARRRGESRRPLKLHHHVEGTVEPWSQRPDPQEIAPLDLAGPAPAPAAADAESLLAAAEELRQLAELGEMCGRVAHEVRNPLASIAATAEVLRDTLDPGDDRREGVEAILAETERLDSLVRDLLAFAQSREPRALEADVADDVDRVVRAAAERARDAGVAIHVEAPATCTPVLVDSELVQHAFAHLASNAIEAMPHGGTLSVRTLEPDLGSSYVCVTFTDTGVGIQAGDAPRVFDPFFTTRADGVGLGLAAARRLVEAQGGHVAVESAPGSGACFTVYLPRADITRS